MVRLTPDSLSQKIAFTAVAFGTIALVLACVGMGTPNWYIQYGPKLSGTGYYKISSVNFFYSCNWMNDGTLINCTKRNGNLYGYPYSSGALWMNDFYQRMQNAGALCIVGIIFIAFGTLATLIMALVYFPTWINLFPPILFFIACLFMLAGMAEGSRYLLYNGYSVNLYQTGHLLTMFALFLSALSAGRIHFSRWTEANINTTPK
ncbi:unnamed protein product [Adineta steineri]|uniref:Uncharacterized protein n=1 Tax=Adineta steineri TaxID=433720 RepID=A0A814QTF7_9BILA|nr:unnamed protein product [Adineta steineri]CAF1179195.1 unnamed protein product [Adineta steineri]CAF1214899.1 unnamed protein product [Adineta steineri]CAF3748635.1 unnamed protein product [Adineta steineri]CAF3784597.1 unnamed protein product [Adineta steineri]